MRYKTGYCFNCADIFETWNPNALGIPRSVYKKYGYPSPRYFVTKVFMYFIELMLLDIIENAVTFVLPLKGNRYGYIYVKVFDGEQFERMYRGGKFMGIDFLSSLFRGYQLFFQYNHRHGVREKPIYINQALKEKFYGYINAGKEYY